MQYSFLLLRSIFHVVALVFFCYILFFFFFSCFPFFFFFQAEDGIRDLVRSRGLGDVYKRQLQRPLAAATTPGRTPSVTTARSVTQPRPFSTTTNSPWACLLYTSDAADERSSVDLGGRRIIQKKKQKHHQQLTSMYKTRSRSSNT